jgi:DNA-binding transcriptional MerR regulator
MHIEDAVEDWRDQELDLSALVRRTGVLLGRLAVEASDGRVATLPEARTIRYYQSAGLLAPPLRYESRQAVYGFDHLMQLAVIKLLQAQGLSLAQVQRTMAASDAAALENVVAEALRSRPSPDGTSEVLSSEASGRSDRIDSDALVAPVSSPPLPPVPYPMASSGLLDSPRPPSRVSIPLSGLPIAARAQLAPRALISVELVPGILLTIDPARVSAPESVIEALARALEPDWMAPDREFPRRIDP